MLYIRYPLSLRNVEDLLAERGYDLCHETVRLWWNRFGPLFAADIRRPRVSRVRGGLLGENPRRQCRLISRSRKVWADWMERWP